MYTSTNPWINFITYFIFSFFILYLIYSPSLHIPFYHHDIYKFSVGGLNKICQEDYGYTNMYAQVRPLAALLDCANFKLANTLEKMSHIRFFCIMLTSLFSSIFSLWLFNKGVSRISSLLFSIAMVCLPGIQTGIIMGSEQLILSPLIAFIAYLCIENANKNIFLTIAGCLLILTSFFMYPSATGFFLVPTLIATLFNPTKEWAVTRKEILRDIMVFFLLSILFFSIAKIIQAHLMKSLDYPSGYVFHPALNWEIINRIMDMSKVFPSLWNINYHQTYQMILIYLILLFGFFPRKNERDLVTISQTIIAVIAILLLSSIAYLSQPSNMVFTRILYVFQVMSLFIVAKACIRLIRFFKFENPALFVGIGLFFVGTIGANTTILKSALNDNMELNYLVSYLNNNFLPHKTIKRIHIVGLPFGSTLNFNGLYPRDDIFNINSTLYRQDSFYMVKTALQRLHQEDSYTLYNCALDELQLMHRTERDCISKAPKNTIIITYSRQGEPISITPHTLIINMTNDKIHYLQHGDQ